MITYIRKKLGVDLFITVQIDVIPRMAEEHNQEHIVECMVFTGTREIR